MEKLSENCKHPIRYAAASRLQHADTDVLCQTVTGASPYTAIYPPAGWWYHLHGVPL